MAVAGTAVLTVTNVGQGTGAYSCSIAWTSDALGNVTGDALNLPAGSILAVEFTPGTGASQPTTSRDASTPSAATSSR